MANRQQFPVITLTEDDVPGAKFSHECIEQHSVAQLKRWLECRSLPVKGNKTALIERCRTCLSANKAGDICVAIDKGQWFQKKMEQTMTILLANAAAVNHQHPPLLPVTGWRTFPSKKIPAEFSYGNIYQHLIASAVQTPCSSFNTDKPLQKGRQYFSSGHVQNIEDALLDNFYFLKSVVRASYSNDSYHVTVTLNTRSSDVADASCDCKASAMGRCSHVAGLLFALEDFTLLHGFDPATCTSKLCEWNVGRQKKKNPERSHTSDYNKKRKTARIVDFVPCAPEASSEFEERFISGLGSLPEKNMFSTLLEYEFEDYSLEPARAQVLMLECEHFYDNISNIFTQNDRPHQIEGTMEQSTSSTWHQQRAIRITASNAKAFIKCSSGLSFYNIIHRVLWGHIITTSAMKYGHTHEGIAFQDYNNAQCQEVIQTGFWVNPKYPGFGCSPDGLIMKDGKLEGLLEIKCPEILKNLTPIEINELEKKKRNAFCCKLNDTDLILKETHAYYYQVQMQMAICEVQWCDFLIWTPKGMHTQKIKFNHDFWIEAALKLKDVYLKVFIPEYFEMRVPRKLIPFML